MERVQLSTNSLIIAIIVVFTVVVIAAGAWLLPGAKVSPQELRSTVEARMVNSKGADNPAITIVEFADFQCPGCAATAPVIKQIVETYGHQVRFAYRHLPLQSIHPNATAAAQASEAAAAQGKFWEMHDLLFSEQSNWSSLSGTQFKAKVIEYAKEIKVKDMAAFEKALNEGTYSGIVQQDLADANKLSLKQTPTVFINGEVIANPTAADIEAKIKQIVPGIEPLTGTPTPTQ